MTETLDINKVINTSTSSVSLDDLEKKGFKQVKVLNQANITRLIGEAVDRVLLERAKEIGKEEREKVIKEARTQFESLAKKRIEKERGRIEELEAESQTLGTEVETLKKRLSATVEMQAQRDQALARVQALEEEVRRLKESVPGLLSELEKARAEAQRLRTEASQAVSLQSELLRGKAQIERLDAEARSLRQAVGESEKRAAQLEGQLAAKDEELAKSSGASGAHMEQLLEAVSDRLSKVAQPTEISQIMLSLDGLSRRLSNISSGGGHGGDAGPDISSDFALNRLFDTEKEGGVESNVNKVKVKETQASNVKSALAKLKRLQKGVTDGE